MECAQNCKATTILVGFHLSNFFFFKTTFSKSAHEGLVYGCNSLLCGRLKTKYLPGHRALCSGTNLKVQSPGKQTHTSRTRSTLINVNGPRNAEVMALTEQRVNARAGLMIRVL